MKRASKGSRRVRRKNRVVKWIERSEGNQNKAKTMIVVAGTIIADVFVRTLAGTVAPGTLTIVDEVGFHLGGAAPNTGAVLGRLDVPVSIVGRIGSDAFGSLVHQQIAAFATRQSLALAARQPTTSVVGQIFKNGERSFLYAAGASAEFCATDIDLEQEKALGARALHLGYALLLPALDGEPMLTLLRQANQLGLLVSLDVAYFPGPNWASIKPLLACVDVFCPNRNEAAAITGTNDPVEAADRLLTFGVRKFVAVKNGERGAYVRQAGQPGIFLDPYRVPVIDTTGAGDAFLAGLLAGWYHGLSWEEAGRVANATAALATTRQGATEGVDSWDQVMTLVKR